MSINESRENSPNMSQNLSVRRLRAQGSATRAALHEKGRRWARFDLPRWRAGMQSDNALRYCYINSGQLFPALRGGFNALFHPWRSEEFVAGYVAELQKQLHSKFQVKDASSAHYDADWGVWRVEIRW